MRFSLGFEQTDIQNSTLRRSRLELSAAAGPRTLVDMDHLNRGGIMKFHHSQPNRLIGTFICAVAAISIALPAAAGASPVNEPAQFGASEHAQLASSSSPALRRDGSKAVPFVADL